MAVSEKFPLPSPVLSYFGRLKGLGSKAPPMLPWWAIIWAFAGSLVAFLILSVFHYDVAMDTDDLVLKVASYAASTLLVFAAPQAPFAQVRSPLRSFCTVFSLW